MSELQILQIFMMHNIQKYIAVVSYDRICIYSTFNMTSFPLLDGTLKYRFERDFLLQK